MDNLWWIVLVTSHIVEEDRIEILASIKIFFPIKASIKIWYTPCTLEKKVSTWDYKAIMYWFFPFAWAKTEPDGSIDHQTHNVQRLLAQQNKGNPKQELQIIPNYCLCCMHPCGVLTDELALGPSISLVAEFQRPCPMGHRYEISESRFTKKIEISEYESRRVRCRMQTPVQLCLRAPRLGCMPQVIAPARSTVGRSRQRCFDVCSYLFFENLAGELLDILIEEGFKYNKRTRLPKRTSRLSQNPVGPCPSIWRCVGRPTSAHEVQSISNVDKVHIQRLCCLLER
jgi:hypothetical protein